MKITIKHHDEVCYEELNVGDVFSHRVNVYMLTDQREEGTKDELKSVNLSTGKMEIFGKKVVVKKYNNAACVLE